MTHGERKSLEMIKLNLLKPRVLPVGTMYLSAAFTLQNGQTWCSLRVFPSKGLSEYNLNRVCSPTEDINFGCGVSN